MDHLKALENPYKVLKFEGDRIIFSGQNNLTKKYHFRFLELPKNGQLGNPDPSLKFLNSFTPHGTLYIYIHIYIYIQWDR